MARANAVQSELLQPGSESGRFATAGLTGVSMSIVSDVEEFVFESGGDRMLLRLLLEMNKPVTQQVFQDRTRRDDKYYLASNNGR